MSPSIGEVCREHLEFMKWADELLLAAVAEHMPENIATLRHIYLAELVWFRRVQGEPNCQIAELEAPPDVAALRLAWADLHRDWLQWAAVLPEWTVDSPHRTSKGIEYHFPVWRIVLHLVNHGSYHRGQVAAMLRAAGIAPPPTDLIAYYRG